MLREIEALHAVMSDPNSLEYHDEHDLDKMYQLFGKIPAPMMAHCKSRRAEIPQGAELIQLPEELKEYGRAVFRPLRVANFEPMQNLATHYIRYHWANVQNQDFCLLILFTTEQ